MQWNQLQAWRCPTHAADASDGFCFFIYFHNGLFIVFKIVFEIRRYCLPSAIPILCGPLLVTPFCLVTRADTASWHKHDLLASQTNPFTFFS